MMPARWCSGCVPHMRCKSAEPYKKFPGKQDAFFKHPSAHKVLSNFRMWSRWIYETVDVVIAIPINHFEFQLLLPLTVWEAYSLHRGWRTFVKNVLFLWKLHCSYCLDFYFFYLFCSCLSFRGVHFTTWKFIFIICKNTSIAGWALHAGKLDLRLVKLLELVAQYKWHMVKTSRNALVKEF